MKRENWVWMPHAGHLIVGSQCRFHLNTWVGKYIVSTVGEYVPSESAQEILAKHRGIKLDGRGDAREASFLNQNGFEDLGLDRKYETMVFPAGKNQGGCCPYRASDWSELDSRGYNNPNEATSGHLAMCEEWARK